MAPTGALVSCAATSSRIFSIGSPGHKDEMAREHQIRACQRGCRQSRQFRRSGFAKPANTIQTSTVDNDEYSEDDQDRTEKCRRNSGVSARLPRRYRRSRWSSGCQGWCSKKRSTVVVTYREAVPSVEIGRREQKWASEIHNIEATTFNRNTRPRKSRQPPIAA